MKTARLALPAGFAAGVLLLTGCAGASGDDGAITLSTLDYYTNDPGLSLYQDALDACADDIGVEIDRETIPGAELVPSILQRASADDLPDVMVIDNPDVSTIAATGGLLPLDEADVEPPTFAPGMLDAATLDGELYGIAPTANTLALFYNEDLLQAAGLTPPTTWDELRTTAAALTSGDTYGLAFSAPDTGEGTWQFLPFMWSNGADETDLSDGAAGEAADYLRSLIDAGSVSESVVTWGQGDVNDQFTAGRAAMMINGPWNIPALQDAESLNWNVVTVPVPASGDEPVAPLGGEIWTAGATGDSASEAKSVELIECINSPENQLELALATWTVPTLDSVTDQFVEEQPDMTAFAQQVALARSRTGELGADWPATSTEIASALQQVLTGRSTGADAFAAD